MSSKSNKGSKLSRRRILPILGGGLLLPFLGFSKSSNIKDLPLDSDDEYQTLLKPDGTTVRVRTSVLKKSKVVKKNVSNTSFLDWLGRKQ